MAELMLTDEAAPGEPMSNALQQRHRILLQAYTCVPNRGSEEGVGWNRAVEAAKYFETWVICRELLCAKHIEAYIERHGRIPGLHFVFLPESRVEQVLERIPGLLYVAYNLWNRRAGRLAEQLHREHHFSLLHHVNYCGYREPGYLWKIDAPFVWGPIGGAQNYPWRFLMKAGLSAAMREGLRTVVNYLQIRYSPRVRHAARRAALLMTATTTNYRAFIQVHNVESVLFIEGGVRDRMPVVPTPRNDRVLRLLWCGVLEPWKALHLLLESLERVSDDVVWELRVVGSGSQHRRWIQLARRYGIADRIEWLGWIPHQEALAQFAWADVLVFSSLRDTSGTVLFEALAAGKPIVCLDHQGAADVVDASCGIKIPVTHPGEVVDALARSIELLGRDPKLRETLGHGARQRVQRYLWSDQGPRMAEMYRRVIAAHQPAKEEADAVAITPSDRQADPHPPKPALENPVGGNELTSGPPCHVETPAAVSEFPHTMPAEDDLSGRRQPLRRLWGRAARTGLFALADQALVSGVRFFTTVMIGRVCGASELGAYTLAFSLMLALLSAQDAFVLGPYTVFGSRLKGIRKASYLGTVLLEAAGLAALAVGALLATATVLTVWAEGSALGGTVATMAIAMPFILLQQFGRRFAFAELDMRTAITLDAATAVIQVGGLVLLVMAGTVTAPAVYGIVGIASALPGFVWLSKTRKSVRVCPDEMPADLRRNWQLGRWMLASQVISVLGAYLTGWLLAWRIDLTATGIYAACASIVCLTNPILLGLNNVLFPRVALAFADGGHAEVRRISRKALAVFVGLTGAAAAMMIVFGELILAALYGPSFAAYYNVVRILALTTLLNAAGMVASQGLLALERSDIGFFAQAAGVCVACIASLSLIPYLGILGAAIGPLVGTAVAASIVLFSYDYLTRPRYLVGD